jgi:hypothetical protein
MNLEDIKKSIDSVNIFNTPYDVNVFKLKDFKQQLINQKYKWPIQKVTLPKGSESEEIDLFTSSDFLRLKDNYKSVVVYTFYTGVLGDYFIRLDITHQIINWLKFEMGYKFVYDNYGLFRKTGAVLGGLGKIASNKLLFSNKFGFNCKIEMIFTKEEFNEYYEFNGNHKLKLCDTCIEKTCLKSCPILLEDNYDVFYEKCMKNIFKTAEEISNYNLNNKIIFKNPHCSDCLNCLYSENLTQHYPENIKNRKYRNEIIEWPYLIPQLEESSFKRDDFKDVSFNWYKKQWMNM